MACPQAGSRQSYSLSVECIQRLQIAPSGPEATLRRRDRGLQTGTPKLSSRAKRGTFRDAEQRSLASFGMTALASPSATVGCIRHRESNSALTPLEGRPSTVTSGTLLAEMSPPINRIVEASPSSSPLETCHGQSLRPAQGAGLQRQTGRSGARLSRQPAAASDRLRPRQQPGWWKEMNAHLRAVFRGQPEQFDK